MVNEVLYTEISELIALRTEGDYWDFKLKWHDNNADLLHDIICMANNQVNRDAYIIIGVSDSKSSDGVRVQGVAEEGRKSQQNLIDFLKDKKFFGGVRPVVYVYTLSFGDLEVDIILIKNTANTPYFLVEPFSYGKECVQSGHIYTRIGDTNTPKKAYADTDKVEYLWRKRFGIDLSVMDKLLLLLDAPDDWVGDFNNGELRYHSLYPEFQIHINDCETDDDYSDNSIVRNIADHNPDTNFAVKDVTITYHTTILYTERVLYLDGYRHLIPFPATDTVYMGRYNELDSSMTYLFFDLSTVMGKLFTCFATTEHNWYNEKWDMRPGVAFLVFEDAAERKEFNRFVLQNLKSVLDEYRQALSDKGYKDMGEMHEYFCPGWSKGNEIKALYMFERYRSVSYRSLADYLPDIAKRIN